MLLVSLPWYDLEEIRWATDALWHEIAAQLRSLGTADVSEDLNRDVHYAEQWKSPHFFFGQACGYDVCISHASRLQVVATPRYRAPGCDGPTHCSFVVVRQDSSAKQLEDLRGARCVINTPTSHSGMNVLRAMVAPLHEDGRFFGDVTVSGSHATSMQMVSSGAVDVAAIDCVTHALLAAHRPAELAGTRVLCHTQCVPAPPYVTAVATSKSMIERLRRALFRAILQPGLAEAKDALLLEGVEVLPFDAYESIEHLDDVALANGFGEIPGLHIDSMF